MFNRSSAPSAPPTLPASAPYPYLDPTQDWRTFACVVSPTNSQTDRHYWLPILSLLTPWRAYVDLTNIDTSDIFIIQTEIKVHAPNSIPRYTKDESGYIWVVDDRLTITVRKVKPGDLDTIHINDAPVSYNKILSIEPLSGPWEARLSIAQTQGVSKQLRLLTL